MRSAYPGLRPSQTVVKDRCRMQPGLTSYARGWACGVPGVAEPLAGWGIPEFLRESAADGARVVQLSDNLPLRATSDAVWRDHADLAATLGLELELGGRGLTEESLGAHLRLCRLLGIGLLRFVIDGPHYTPSVAVAEGIIRNQLSDVPSDGPLLALENHDRFPVRELSRLVSRIDDERVGICLDTANSLGSGEGLASVLTHLAPHTVNLHLKDIRVRRVPSRFGFIVSGCRLGDGVVDVAATLEILHRRGRCRSALIESWVEPGSGLEAARLTEAAWAREGLSFLNGLLARHDR